jgi:hypothetical protein
MKKRSVNLKCQESAQIRIIENSTRESTNNNDDDDDDDNNNGASRLVAGQRPRNKELYNGSY